MRLSDVTCSTLLASNDRSKAVLKLTAKAHDIGAYYVLAPKDCDASCSPLKMV
ncbi:hypothetical protein O9992_25840 [Vibrio lentus]|nr:hypothetical protein [Vibrio lentus]